MAAFVDDMPVAAVGRPCGRIMVWSAPPDPSAWQARPAAGLLHCIQQERADHVRWLWVHQVAGEEQAVARSARLPKAAGDLYAMLALQSVGELLLLAGDGRGGYVLREPWQHWLVCYGDEPRAMERLMGLYAMARKEAQDARGREAEGKDAPRRRRRRERGIG